MPEEWIPVEKPPLGKVRDLSKEHEFKYTQAIIIRTDLKMSKGKLAVQAAHASVGAFLEQDARTVREAWFAEGQRKITLKADNDLHLYLLRAAARTDFGIPAYLVTDFGLTEFKEPTITCLGLGPCTIEQMNKLTNGLKLY